MSIKSYDESRVNNLTEQPSSDEGIAPGERSAFQTFANSTALQTHAWCISEQIRPVLLHPRSKAAVHADYINRTAPVEEFRNGNNIGGCTGKLLDGSGTLLDVDLDSKLSAHLAEQFLPATPAIFGRAGKPRSHRLYKVKSSEHKTVKFLDPIFNKTIAELRGDGAWSQTVLPGSYHQESGEFIDWSADSYPPIPWTEHEKLLLGVRKIAAAEALILHVWQEGVRNEAVKHVTGMLCHFQWAESDIEQFIAVVMEFAGDKDKSRIPTLRTTCRKFHAGLKVTGGPTLKKILGDSRVVHMLYTLFAPPDSPDFNPLLLNLLEFYDIVNVDGKTVVLRWKERKLYEGPHGEHEVPEMSSAQSFKLYHADKLINIDDKLVPVSKLFIFKAARYDGLELHPGKEPVVGGSLNLWRGFAVTPSPGGWSLMRQHMLEVIAAGDQEFFNYLLKWTAWTVQNPGERAGVAIGMRGREGIGKGAFAGTLCRLFGPHALQISNPDHLTGRFNLHLAQCCLLFVDEGFWAGDKSADGPLKRSITEPTLFIEPKNVNPFQVKNCLHIIIAGNNEWIVPAGPDARRFAVTNVSDHKKGDKVYFDTLNAEVNGGGLAAMLHELLELELGDWHPQHSKEAPQNKALQDQKMQSLKGIDAVVMKLAYEGSLPYALEKQPNVTLSSGEENRTGLWYYAKQVQPELRFTNSVVLSNRLRDDYGCRRYKSGYKRGFIFPPLKELRAKLTEKYGPQEWDDTEEWEGGMMSDSSDGDPY